MHLFQPAAKVGNMDCTFLVSIASTRAHPRQHRRTVPGPDAYRRPGARPRPFRRWPCYELQPALTWRPLVLVLVFGAFANAAGMVGPVVEWQASLRLLLWTAVAALLAVSLFCVAALVVLPVLAVGSGGRPGAACGAVGGG